MCVSARDCAGINLDPVEFPYASGFLWGSSFVQMWHALHAFLLGRGCVGCGVRWEKVRE